MASEPGTQLAAIAVSVAVLAFWLMTLITAALAPAKPSQTGGSPAFRPALAVMALHAPPSHAPLVQRLDRDGSVVSAAEIDLPVDPALPSPPVEFVATQRAVTTAFRLTSATLPTPAPLSSPLRPPRAA